MLSKFNSFMTFGLLLFVAGLILPFADVYIIKSVGKPAESIGIVLLFISIAAFIAGTALILFGFHKQNKQLRSKLN